MKIIVPILLFITASSANHKLSKRQTQGYTTNVAHQDPQFPEESARSTVSVSFNPNQQQESRKVARYTSSFQKSPSFETAAIGGNVYPSRQVSTIGNGNTQLFNVGYSVRFHNKPPSPPVQRDLPSFLRPNLDNGEIITGTRKANEQVNAPVSAESTQQFTINSLDDKKHKLSGIKPKPSFLTPYKQEKLYLSPNTQKYLKDLEQSNQPLYKTEEDAKKFHDQNYSWRNLGSSVEIIRSSEIPANSQEFDHTSALGRSQSFDFSNGVDIKDSNYYQGAATSVFPTYNTYQSSQPQEFLPPISSKAPSRPVTLDDIPTSKPPTNQNFARLPLDTSLLRDPYLSTNAHNIPNNPNVVPIHFNVRPLEEVMKNHLHGFKTNLEQTATQHVQEYYQNPLPQPQALSSPYQYNHNVHYSQPIYDTPQSQAVYQAKQKKEQSHQYEPLQQDSFFHHNQQDQKYPSYDNHDHQPAYQDHSQNKFPYKIYGKPKPVKPLKYTQYKSTLKNHRQPRGQNQKGLLNLRPPPAKPVQLQRKVLVNYY